MKRNAALNETIIANALVSILERIIEIEKAIVKLAQPASVESTQQTIIKEKLDRLTLKRHAVLTATLGGLSYKAIAALMECDVTTVKLHLKATLDLLQFRTRALLLVSSPSIVSFISDAEYEQRYGVSKCWWLEKKPELLVALRPSKASNNQHTKTVGSGKGPVEEGSSAP